MSPPAFPITPEGLIGDWTFDAVQPGELEVEGFAVRGLRGRPQGRSHLRVHGASGVGSIGYVPDHAPELGVSEDALAALAGVDVLIHDAQFLEHERPRAVDYGHATVDDAIRLAERVGAGSVVLFHHGPHRTDDALDAIGREFTASVPIVVAAEGLVLDLPDPARQPSHPARVEPARALECVACGSSRSRTCTTGCPTTTGSSRPRPTPTSSSSRVTWPTS